MNREKIKRSVLKRLKDMWMKDEIKKLKENAPPDFIFIDPDVRSTHDYYVKKAKQLSDKYDSEGLAPAGERLEKIVDDTIRVDERARESAVRLLKAIFGDEYNRDEE